MNRIITFILIFLCCGANAQTNLPDWGKQRLLSLESVFKMDNQLEPSFLEADFSGDGVTDIAIFIEKIEDHKKGVLIFFGERDLYFLAGGGNTFGSGGNNYDWADSWTVFNEKDTYEMTFEENGDIAGEREVSIERPAISIREFEGSGGLIYYNGNKFIWIHQGD